MKYRFTDAMIETLQAIREMEDKDEETTIYGIATELSAPYNTVYQRLRNYLTMGLIEVDDFGEYSLTEEGESVLEIGLNLL